MNKSATTTVFLLTGGNLGKRQEHLSRARQMIGELCGTIEQSSSIYETAAWGPISQQAYLNQVLQLATHLPPNMLLHQLLDIEKAMGRRRLERFGPRTIDIDILFYGNLVLDEPGLIIPHPRLYIRRFVLEPLAEIAPEWKHPILDLTVKELLENCTDPLDVKKFIAPDEAD